MNIPGYSGALAGATVTALPQQGPLAATMSELEQAIAHLGQGIVALAEKASYVTVQRPAGVNQQAKAPEPARSAATQQACELLAQVRTLIDCVNHLRESID